jgi:hypothetical protein
MKIFKAFIITLAALLLTGCYTQLQYSQRMKKITDEEKKEVKGYSWNGEEEADEDVQIERETGKRAEIYPDTTVSSEEYVPLYYKDYEYQQKYADCNCNPYNVYNYYGDNYYGYDYYGYDYYRPYSSYYSNWSLSPFYYHPWRYHSYYASRFYTGFAFSISWGSPHFYHSFYYDPFYDPYYSPYWYGRSPYAYTYGKFYGYYGKGYYYGGEIKQEQNVRYGPRSIGSNRVVNNSNRSRDARVSGRAASQSSRQAVRTRSVGASRSAATVNRNRSSRTTVNRTRNSSNNSTTVRSRSRDNTRQDRDNRQRVYIDRREESRPVIIDRDRYREIRTRRLNNSTVKRLEERSELRSELRKARIRPETRETSIQRNHPTFFQRMKGFFDNNVTRINNVRSTNRTNGAVRSRSSSTRRTSVGRSSSSSRSRVTRSRSSSSHSKSRSRSSSSRSRSGGSSSGSERSRGNN